MRDSAMVANSGTVAMTESVSGKSRSMGWLQIDLQDGLAGDTVVIRVNGEEVFHRAGVSTRWQISFAESLRKEVAKGAAVIEIALPNRNLAETVRLDVTDRVFLGVSVSAAGSIVCRIQSEPFMYV